MQDYSFTPSPSFDTTGPLFDLSDFEMPGPPPKEPSSTVTDRAIAINDLSLSSLQSTEELISPLEIVHTLIQNCDDNSLLAFSLQEMFEQEFLPEDEWIEVLEFLFENNHRSVLNTLNLNFKVFFYRYKYYFIKTVSNPTIINSKPLGHDKLFAAAVHKAANNPELMLLEILCSNKELDPEMQEAILAIKAEALLYLGRVLEAFNTLTFAIQKGLLVDYEVAYLTCLLLPSAFPDIPNVVSIKELAFNNLKPNSFQRLIANYISAKTQAKELYDLAFIASEMKKKIYCPLVKISSLLFEEFNADNLKNSKFSDQIEKNALKKIQTAATKKSSFMAFIYAKSIFNIDLKIKLIEEAILFKDLRVLLNFAIPYLKDLLLKAEKKENLLTCLAKLYLAGRELSILDSHTYQKLNSIKDLIAPASHLCPLPAAPNVQSPSQDPQLNIKNENYIWDRKKYFFSLLKLADFMLDHAQPTVAERFAPKGFILQILSKEPDFSNLVISVIHFLNKLKETTLFLSSQPQIKDAGQISLLVSTFENSITKQIKLLERHLSKPPQAAYSAAQSSPSTVYSLIEKIKNNPTDLQSLKILLNHLLEKHQNQHLFKILDKLPYNITIASEIIAFFYQRGKAAEVFDYCKNNEILFSSEITFLPKLFQIAEMYVFTAKKINQEKACLESINCTSNPKNHFAFFIRIHHSLLNGLYYETKQFILEYLQLHKNYLNQNDPFLLRCLKICHASALFFKGDAKNAIALIDEQNSHLGFCKLEILILILLINGKTESIAKLSQYLNKNNKLHSLIHLWKKLYLTSNRQEKINLAIKYKNVIEPLDSIATASYLYFLIEADLTEFLFEFYATSPKINCDNPSDFLFAICSRKFYSLPDFKMTVKVLTEGLKKCPHKLSLLMISKELMTMHKENETKEFYELVRTFFNYLDLMPFPSNSFDSLKPLYEKAKLFNGPREEVQKSPDSRRFFDDLSSRNLSRKELEKMLLDDSQSEIFLKPSQKPNELSVNSLDDTPKVISEELERVDDPHGTTFREYFDLKRNSDFPFIFIPGDKLEKEIILELVINETNPTAYFLDPLKLNLNYFINILQTKKLELIEEFYKKIEENNYNNDFETASAIGELLYLIKNMYEPKIEESLNQFQEKLSNLFEKLDIDKSLTHFVGLRNKKKFINFSNNYLKFLLTPSDKLIIAYGQVTSSTKIIIFCGDNIPHFNELTFAAFINVPALFLNTIYLSKQKLPVIIGTYDEKNLARFLSKKNEENYICIPELGKYINSLPSLISYQQKRIATNHAIQTLTDCFFFWLDLLIKLKDSFFDLRQIGFSQCFKNFNSSNVCGIINDFITMIPISYISFIEFLSSSDFEKIVTQYLAPSVSQSSGHPVISTSLEVSPALISGRIPPNPTSSKALTISTSSEVPPNIISWRIPSYSTPSRTSPISTPSKAPVPKRWTPFNVCESCPSHTKIQPSSLMSKTDGTKEESESILFQEVVIGNRSFCDYLDAKKKSNVPIVFILEDLLLEDKFILESIIYESKPVYYCSTPLYKDVKLKHFIKIIEQKKIEIIETLYKECKTQILINNLDYANEIRKLNYLINELLKKEIKIFESIKNIQNQLLNLSKSNDINLDLAFECRNSPINNFLLLPSEVQVSDSFSNKRTRLFITTSSHRPNPHDFEIFFYPTLTNVEKILSTCQKNHYLIFEKNKRQNNFLVSSDLNYKYPSLFPELKTFQVLKKELNSTLKEGLFNQQNIKKCFFVWFELIFKLKDSFVDNNGFSKLLYETFHAFEQSKIITFFIADLESNSIEDLYRFFRTKEFKAEFSKFLTPYKKKFKSLAKPYGSNEFSVIEQILSQPNSSSARNSVVASVRKRKAESELVKEINLGKDAKSPSFSEELLDLSELSSLTALDMENQPSIALIENNKEVEQTQEIPLGPQKSPDDKILAHSIFSPRFGEPRITEKEPSLQELPSQALTEQLFTDETADETTFSLQPISIMPKEIKRKRRAESEKKEDREESLTGQRKKKKIEPIFEQSKTLENATQALLTVLPLDLTTPPSQVKRRKIDQILDERLNKSKETSRVDEINTSSSLRQILEFQLAAAETKRIEKPQNVNTKTDPVFFQEVYHGNYLLREYLESRKNAEIPFVLIHQDGEMEDDILLELLIHEPKPILYFSPAENKQITLELLTELIQETKLEMIQTRLKRIEKQIQTNYLDHVKERMQRLGFILHKMILNEPTLAESLKRTRTQLLLLAKSKNIDFFEGQSFDNLMIHLGVQKKLERGAMKFLLQPTSQMISETVTDESPAKIFLVSTMHIKDNRFAAVFHPPKLAYSKKHPILMIDTLDATTLNSLFYSLQKKCPALASKIEDFFQLTRKIETSIKETILSQDSINDLHSCFFLWLGLMLKLKESLVDTRKNNNLSKLIFDFFHELDEEKIITGFTSLLVFPSNLYFDHLHKNDFFRNELSKYLEPYKKLAKPIIEAIAKFPYEPIFETRFKTLEERLQGEKFNIEWNYGSFEEERPTWHMSDVQFACHEGSEIEKELFLAKQKYFTSSEYLTMLEAQINKPGSIFEKELIDEVRNEKEALRLNIFNAFLPFLKEKFRQTKNKEIKNELLNLLLEASQYARSHQEWNALRKFVLELYSNFTNELISVPTEVIFTFQYKNETLLNFYRLIISSLKEKITTENQYELQKLLVKEFSFFLERVSQINRDSSFEKYEIFKRSQLETLFN